MSQRSLILIALALIAIAFYAIGFKYGVLFVFVFAVGMELYFWYRYLSAKSKHVNHSKE